MSREAMSATRLTAKTAMKTPRKVNTVMLDVACVKGKIRIKEKIVSKRRA